MITSKFENGRIISFNAYTLKFTESKIKYAGPKTPNLDFQEMFLKVVEDLIKRSNEEFENGFEIEKNPVNGALAAGLDSNGNLEFVLIRKDKIGSANYSQRFEVLGAVPHFESGGEKGMKDFMWGELKLVAERKD